MKDPNRYSSINSKQRQGDSGEFSLAMARLEKAVQEIVDVTKGQLTERAANLIDDTTQRLESELRLRRATDDPDVEVKQARRRRKTKYRHRLVDRAERVNPLSGRLYRDVQNKKIGGVCAGFARYFGLQTWGVRLGALTGVLFLPGIFFPAYWIAYFLMDTPEGIDDEQRTRRDRKRRKRRPRRHRQDEAYQSHQASAAPTQPFAAGRELRYASADFTEAELRLRRLESFVTSDQYELQKELTKIEHESADKSQAAPSNARV